LDADAQAGAAPTGAATPRWVGVALVALSVAFVWIAWSAREPGVTTGNDDARYMLLARALREGTYRDLYRGLRELIARAHAAGRGAPPPITADEVVDVARAWERLKARM
jgi:hypothetical protein